MQNPNIESGTATISKGMPERRKLLVPGALAVAVVLALSGTYLGVAKQATASLPSSEPTPMAAFSGPPSFAEVAERVTPAVVNVAVTQRGTADTDPKDELPRLPEGTPFDEFFQRFFREGSPFSQGFDPRRQTRGQGSGFIIDPDGHIVTNNHVVENATGLEILLNDGTKYEARVVGRDSRTDLAVLKIDADRALPHVELGSSDRARVGDWVLAVGNPFGLGGSVSAGIISARGRDINSGPYDDYLQIDAPINRGNSGGPLFDATGRVIGVNTAIYSPSGGNVGIGFAIPSSAAAEVIAELKAHGRVERGWLGVQIQPVTDGIAAALDLTDLQGALLAEVLADSPAAKAGLQTGDLILSLDDKPIADVKDLSRMVAEMRPGTQVRLAVQRKGAEKELDLVIGEMPGEERGKPAPASNPKDGEPRLGLYLAPLTEDARKARGLEPGATGVLVTRVESGSGAERAGIRPGTLITMVGQREVATPDEAASSVRQALAKGTGTVLLRIERDGEARFVTVEPAA